MEGLNSSRGGRGSSVQAMKIAVHELFNHYLGRSSTHKTEDARETSFQLRKRITAINRDPRPRNEQFLLDFQQLQGQFSDQDQLRSATESVLLALIVQCSSHTLQAEFLLFALQMLSGINFINWDSFLSSLLSSVSVAEISSAQSSQAHTGMPSVGSSVTGNTMPGMTMPNSSIAQSSNPASPMTSLHVIGSPPHGVTDPATSVNQSPVKGSDPSSSGQQIPSRGTGCSRGTVMSCLRQLVCKVVLAGLEHDLKPVTHADIFSHMLDWLLSWNPRQQNRVDEHDSTKIRKFDSDSFDWLHSCLAVVWALVDEDRCRIPFYELLHSGIQFVDNVPDDEALFALILEIHRRRDKIAIHMQMLDQHLHCPTFATLRVAPQIYPSIPGELSVTFRSSPLTYPSVLGEPLHGEMERLNTECATYLPEGNSLKELSNSEINGLEMKDVAIAIQRGSMDWERALRCLRHALHTMPSPDWWRRVLVIAPCYRQHVQQQLSGYGIVFSSEMICEAAIDRIMELMQPLSTGVAMSSSPNVSLAEENRWQQWLAFADLFFFLMKNGYIDFLDFVDKLATRFTSGEQQIARTNHVTWLLAQVFRIDIATNALNTDSKKMETARKILSFHKEERPSDQTSSNTPQSTLLEFISSSQTLRVWSINPSIMENLNTEQRQKGRQLDEWWKQVSKGERPLDYLNLDEKSTGMFWVLSHTMTQPACEAIMNWLNSNGIAEVLLQGSINQLNERLAMMRETHALPISLLSGLSLHLCLRLANQIEETMFSGQVVPSIAMVETYVRLLLIAPHSLFRLHFNVLQRFPSTSSKTGVQLLLLETLNCRLIPLYRYHGKVKQLIYDVAKIIIMNKGKRGEHRLFRLAENLCINLFLCLSDIILVKKDLKGPTEFTETLNRIMITNLAITIKTRGIAEFEQMVFLQPLVEQIMLTSNHTWSEKTMRHFPPLIRDALSGRTEKRVQLIQAWQQAETTVLNQCTQLLSLSDEPTYVATYINHSFPQHRQYLCAGAWMLMDGHPEGINSANLGRVLKELSPEEVTSNIYTMVDVLLHHIQLQLQLGHSLQDLLLKASANLAFLMWTHQLLPLDIVLLALIDRDDDAYALRLVVALLLDRQEFQKRVQHYCMNRGPPEHWLKPGPFQRIEPQQALGNHLAGKDRYPLFFDDMAVRGLPVIPLIIYRLIENDATDTAERVLAAYSGLMVYHPLRFTFVRGILAYFHGHIPNKLVMRILSILDIPKIPFSEAFLQHIGSTNSGSCPPSDYFTNLLLGLVNYVIPPIRSSVSMGDSSGTFSCTGGNRAQAAIQSIASNVPECQKVFYQNQDPGTYTQLLLETAVIEILSLPPSVPQIVSTLVQIVVHVQPTQVQSSHSVQGMSSGISQSSMLPTSPSGGTGDSMSTNKSTASAPGLNATGTGLGNSSAAQASSSLMIQACGLLLAQLPSPFHMQFYLEAARVIKDCWWLTDVTKTSLELDSAFGYALWDPTWAFQDNTSTTIGNIIALLHAFFSNLPHEWLEATHTIIKHMRPITTIAQLRIAFRIMGPLLPRVAIARPLFKKTLALLFSVLADVFGRNSQVSIPVEATEISDLIDFLHHAVLYEVQGTTQNGAKPKPETLSLCSKAVEHLRPDLQHLLRHLTADPNSSIYAATHPKIVQRPTSPLPGVGVV